MLLQMARFQSFLCLNSIPLGLPRWLSSKESTCQADVGSIPGSGRSPRKGPTPVFLPEEFHRQRSLQSMGSQRVGHDLAINQQQAAAGISHFLCICVCMYMNVYTHTLQFIHSGISGHWKFRLFLYLGYHE